MADLDLAPCPFCAAAGPLVAIHIGPLGTTIHCDRCQAEGPNTHRNSEAAIGAWNFRPKQSAPDAAPPELAVFERLAEEWEAFAAERGGIHRRVTGRLATELRAALKEARSAAPAAAAGPSPAALRLVREALQECISQLRRGVRRGEQVPGREDWVTYHQGLIVKAYAEEVRQLIARSTMALAALDAGSAPPRPLQHQLDNGEPLCEAAPDDEPRATVLQPSEDTNCPACLWALLTDAHCALERGRAGSAPGVLLTEREEGPVYGRVLGAPPAAEEPLPGGALEWREIGWQTFEAWLPGKTRVDVSRSVFGTWLLNLDWLDIPDLLATDAPAAKAEAAELVRQWVRELAGALGL